MPYIKFSATIDTTKTSNQILSSLLNLFSNDEIVGLGITNLDAQEEESYSEYSEESVSEEVSGENMIATTTEEQEVRPATNLDWTNASILRDLYRLSCNAFCYKYDVSAPTFYTNRKKRKEQYEELESDSTYKHTRTEFAQALLKPDDFLSEFNYDEKELADIQGVAKKFLRRFYNNKYPNILNYAGQFTDKTVGERYGIAGATVCNIRRLLGIPSSNS